MRAITVMKRTTEAFISNMVPGHENKVYHMIYIKHVFNYI
jgi:hypothetical protein